LVQNGAAVLYSIVSGNNLGQNSFLPRNRDVPDEI